MRKFIHGCLDLIGLDLRWKANLLAARAAEKAAAEERKWDQLRRYKPSTILDIGANAGSFVTLMRRICPDATIISFEPLLDCFQQLQEVTHSVGNAFAFQYALGEVNGTAIIHRSSFSPSSSLLQMADLHKTEFPYSAGIKSETIEVRRLDDVVHETNLADPIVVKVDVQGFEDRVLRGGTETIQRASGVVLELTSYPLYSDQAEFLETAEHMRSLGFVYRGNIDQMLSPVDGRILQFDALFENLKTIDACTEQTPTRIRKST